MKNGKIIYFSRTGRTEFMAKYIHKNVEGMESSLEPIKFSGKVSKLMQLEEKLKEGDFSSLEFDQSIFNFEPYEIILIGMPVYGGKPPTIFDGLLRKANGLEEKSIIPFATGRIYTKTMIPNMKQRIEERGAKVPFGKAVRNFFKIKTSKIDPLIEQIEEYIAE